MHLKLDIVGCLSQITNTAWPSADEIISYGPEMAVPQNHPKNCELIRAPLLMEMPTGSHRFVYACFMCLRYFKRKAALVLARFVWHSLIIWEGRPGSMSVPSFLSCVISATFLHNYFMSSYLIWHHPRIYKASWDRKTGGAAEQLWKFSGSIIWLMDQYLEGHTSFDWWTPHSSPSIALT